MGQGKKHILIAAGVAFVCGVAVSLAAMSLCNCPKKRHRMERPRMAIEQTVGKKHDGMKKRFEHAPRHEGRVDKFGREERFDKHAKLMGEHFRRRSDGAEMKERFAKKLKLTDEQKAQIEAFRKEDMAKIEPLFAKMDELRKEADKLRDANKARFESILTPEQKEILADMHKKRMERMDRPHRAGGAPVNGLNGEVPASVDGADDVAREVPADGVLSSDVAGDAAQE